MLASMLEADMAGVGEMSVSRDPLDEGLNCLGAAHYRITFVSRRDYVPLMSVEEMVYETLSVGGTYSIMRTQESTILGGTFLLTMPVVQHAGHGAHCESIRVGVEVCHDPILQPLEITRPLAWNITDVEMAYEIQRSIWYVHDRNKTSTPLTSPLAAPRISVTRSNPDQQRGFTWTVTFHATEMLYDPPNMLIDVSGMSGYVPRGEVFTPSEGVAPLAGTFRMGFRGVGHVWHGVRTGLDTSVGGDQYMSLTSTPIPWNATSEQMESALESMGAVENVVVTRSGMRPGGGFTWTVTFKTGEDRRAGWDAKPE
jgi:hypothetical protein